jgi:hypothetical protein
MTEHDMEQVLEEVFGSSEEMHLDGIGAVRIISARPFGNRMLTLNKGMTLSVEWDEECEDDDGKPVEETYRADFQLIITKSSNNIRKTR